MDVIVLISTSELTLVFLITRTFDLNFEEDIVGIRVVIIIIIIIIIIRVEPLVQALNNNNSQINSESTIKISHFFVTLTL